MPREGCSNVVSELSDNEILQRAGVFRPSCGGRIDPALLGARLGTTHVAGRYALTDEPYLIEGARAVHERLGYRHLKLWFANPENTYSWNSDWALPPDYSLAQLAAHPYYRAAFAFPFESFALEVYFTQRGRHQPRPKGWMIPPDLDFGHEEKEICDLGVHLLETYRERDVTFILQNWEGDWMLREFAGAEWTDPAKRPSDTEERVLTFTRWAKARQAGVDCARERVPDSRCRLLHAIEVNRVFDLLEGAPTVTSHVLPQVETDLVSWSAYDGMYRGDQGTGDAAAVGMWRGLDLIKRHARTRERGPDGRPQVMIGEFGISENRLRPEQSAADILEGTLAAALAHDCPLLHYWELYCNEPQDKSLKDRPLPSNLPAHELSGLWLIRPDGSLSLAGDYFAGLLAAG
jgi:hypothetical protein